MKSFKQVMLEKVTVSPNDTSLDFDDIEMLLRAIRLSLSAGLSDLNASEEKNYDKHFTAYKKADKTIRILQDDIKSLVKTF